MSPLLRSRNFFILVSYLSLSLVPFIPLLFGRDIQHPERIIGMEFIAWVTVWSIFKRPFLFHWLLIPAFVALPIELYLHAYYGQGITTHHLGIIAETSPREALEFLGYKVWFLLAIALFVVLWWYLVLLSSRKSNHFDWSDVSRWHILTILFLFFSLWLYGHEFGHFSSPAHVSKQSINSPSSSSSVSPSTSLFPQDEQQDSDFDSEDNQSSSFSPFLPSSIIASVNFPKLPYWTDFPFEFDSFGKTWPFGLVVHGYNFWKEREYLGDLSNKSKTFSFGAFQPADIATPQVFVVVIGESSRYDRWSLNGYNRDTNPLLQLEENLVSLTNILTPVSATRLSVPILVSRKPATQSLKAGFSEKSFLSAFKEAGFKTFWLSNQMSFGEFDTPISVFAKEADVTQFLNLGGFTNTSNYDQILLEPLKIAIADPSQKKLIVLHTLGNHWNYSHRYPKEFDHWKPSLFGIENPAYTDLKLKPELNNSYDNSILYTDWFLSQVIGTLKSTNQISSMMFVSDHGQTLYDGTCNLAFHGHNTEYEFHIPAFVWYSDIYKFTYPEKIQRLVRNRRAKLTTENIFHSLLDMANIHYPTERLERSFFSQKLKKEKRYVDSYGWSDYDNASLKGDCREVIDKGTPLHQEK